MTDEASDILKIVHSLRQEVGVDFHDHLAEALYTDAAQIADRAVMYPGTHPLLTWTARSTVW